MSEIKPGKIASDMVSTVVALGFLFCLFGAPMMFGVADTIEAYGDAMRWAFGG